MKTKKNIDVRALLLDLENIENKLLATINYVRCLYNYFDKQLNVGETDKMKHE